MKFLLTSLALLATSLPAFSQGCNCNELQRRINGLQTVVNYQAAGPDTGRLTQEIRRARWQYQRALQSDYQTQDGLCSVGNQQLDLDWQRWQAWLATQGLDAGNVCG